MEPDNMKYSWEWLTTIPFRVGERTCLVSLNPSHLDRKGSPECLINVTDMPHSGEDDTRLIMSLGKCNDLDIDDVRH